MNERELGRGWVLQTWPNHEAAPRLCLTRAGVVLAIDQDDDVVLERERADYSNVIPLGAIYDLVAATALYRSGTNGRRKETP